MYQHKTIEQLGAELDRQTAAKHDYLVPSSKIEILDKNGVKLGSRPETFAPTGWYHAQVAKLTDFPQKFYDTVMQENQAEWAALVNARMHSRPAKQLVRTLDGNARAILSNGYFLVEHSDVARAIINAVGTQKGWEIVAGEVTDSRLYLKVLTPQVRDVKSLSVNDTVRFGFTITNSEVGMGAYEARHYRHWLRCRNGAIGESMLRKVHMGQRISGYGDDAEEIFSDRTKNLVYATLMSQTQDLIKHIASPVFADRAVAKLTDAIERPIVGDVQEVVVATGKQFGLGINEGKGVLDAIIKQGLGTTQYALGNAITQMAQDLENYDRRFEVESIGNDVLELDGGAWQKLLKAAETETKKGKK